MQYFVSRGRIRSVNCLALFALSAAVKGATRKMIATDAANRRSNRDASRHDNRQRIIHSFIVTGGSRRRGEPRATAGCTRLYDSTKITKSTADDDFHFIKTWTWPPPESGASGSHGQPDGS